MTCAAFGEQEAMSVIERLNGSIESTYSELIQFRGDLSYVPGNSTAPHPNTAIGGM